MFARIENNTVAEIIPYDTLEDKFTASFISTCIECGSDVLAGWSYSDGVFTAPEEATLEQAKAIKLEEIQREKCRVRDAGFEVNGIHFDSDTAARLSYIELSMRIAADNEFTTQWKASGNTWVTMTYALYSQIAAAGENLLSSVFAWQSSKQSDVEAASSIEEVRAISASYV